MANEQRLRGGSGPQTPIKKLNTNYVWCAGLQRSLVHNAHNVGPLLLEGIAISEATTVSEVSGAFKARQWHDR